MEINAKWALGGWESEPFLLTLLDLLIEKKF